MAFPCHDIHVHAIWQNHRGVHPPSQWCILLFFHISWKSFNFPPYFCKIYKFPPYFRKIYVFVLNYVFYLPPYFDLHHALHVLDAPAKPCKTTTDKGSIGYWRRNQIQPTPVHEVAPITWHILICWRKVVFMIRASSEAQSDSCKDFSVFRLD